MAVIVLNPELVPVAATGDTTKEAGVAIQMGSDGQHQRFCLWMLQAE
jgi:hypothetical protein